jgi:type I restriction enzyme M protein
MRWVAPTEKDEANHALEKRLWAAADQFRANSGLKAGQYSTPVLGLIFLRFAEARFAQQRKKLEKGAASSRRGSRIDDPKAYQAEGVLFLTPCARFDYLLNQPEGANAGKAVNEAMADIEKHNPQLKGVLPHSYQIFNSILLKELLKTISEIPVSLDFDAFGRIYEYFLGQFARTEGQKGGEFYTPAPIVRLMVEVLEPFKGRIIDPACGSGGMFVQSARFVAEHKKSPASELSIFGVEKTDDTGRLARMNLAVHGLEGQIVHGGDTNSYYDDYHDAVGAFDFALANPPFNVNAVDKERLKDAVGVGRRFPFGLPRTDNANYLWIQLFYSSLNDKGRAGFVMASGAESASGSELDIRRDLLKSNAIDVMVAVGPKMFYTVTLPCMLWFFDRGKRKTRRSERILFVDARHIYRQVDRARRDWTDAQIGFLANIVRLYRGEEPDFTLGGEDARGKLREMFGRKPKYADTKGLCKAATLEEIAAQGWSLNPGRYVGVAPGEDVSNQAFQQQFEMLNEELETLNAEANELQQQIASNAEEVLRT